ncbi:MAG TPA: efflux RND transporter periplasmic adaptor subunit [Paucimonas sp.]|nr:efflux RND transporter periplasmic adaptor subunit [Paucimonas sp.]
MNHALRSLRIAATLLLLSAVAACGDRPANAQAPGGAAPPPEVSVMTVAPAAVTLSADLPGRLQATRTAQVRARVEGIVQQRVFREGSDVKAGELLFKIEPAPLIANVEAAQAELAKAEADAAQARAKAERFQKLGEQGIVSKQDQEETAARARQTQAEVAAAKAALTKAKLDLNHANVTAPISGHAGRALVTEGALVGKGEATPLAVIEQIDPIYVNFVQSSGEFSRIKRAIDAGRLKSGAAAVKLMLEDGSDYPHDGKLLFSDLTVDPATGDVSLRAEFPNRERHLLPGMFVRVRFPQAVAEGALTIPQRALVRNAQGSSVLTVGADGKVAALPVKVGQAVGDRWIVTEGLKGGEQVIVEGLQKVKPGAPAKAVPFEGTPRPPAAGAQASAPQKGKP